MIVIVIKISALILRSLIRIRIRIWNPQSECGFRMRIQDTKIMRIRNTSNKWTYINLSRGSIWQRHTTSFGKSSRYSSVGENRKLSNRRQSDRRNPGEFAYQVAASRKAFVLHEEPLSRCRYTVTLYLPTFGICGTNNCAWASWLPDSLSPQSVFVVKNLGVKSLMKIYKKYFGRARSFGSIN